MSPVSIAIACAPKRALQPLVDPSVACFAAHATQQPNSYRFPIVETSATALDAKMDECDMDKSNRQKEVRQSCLR